MYEKDMKKIKNVCKDMKKIKNVWKRYEKDSWKHKKEDINR